MKKYEQDKVLCTDCLRDGHESMVYIKRNTYASMEERQRDLVYRRPSPIVEDVFYDHEGVFHRHKQGSQTINFKCQRGHEFSRKYGHPCPNCNW